MMQGNLPIIYLLLFTGSFIFSLLINYILLKFSRTLGIRNNPEMQIRWSDTVKPALGGISFFLIFLISFLLSGLLTNSQTEYISNKKLIALLCTLTLSFILGLSDDAFDTKPLLKFSAQVLCAISLILGDIKIECFQSEFLNYALTIFWVVGIMNSFNMLDNMDGIATIMALNAFIFFIFADFFISGTLTINAVILIGVLGALLAFLFFNWHPSKMFMGDTGSQFLGALLAVNGIHLCWNFPTTFSNSITFFPIKNLTLLLIIFILPITDTAAVFINRLAKGNSPFIGGKDHTTHHLYFKGMSEKKIGIIFLLIGFSAFLIAQHLIGLNSANLSNYLPYLTFPLVIALALYLNTVIKKRNQ